MIYLITAGGFNMSFNFSFTFNTLRVLNVNIVAIKCQQKKSTKCYVINFNLNSKNKTSYINKTIFAQMLYILIY